MRQETSDQAIQERNFGFIALAALAAAAALLAAGSARANNDFQNGFEDELGRIVAHTAVGAGVQILTGGYYPAVVPVAPVVHATYYRPHYAPNYGPRYAPYYPPRYAPYYGPRKVVVVKHPKAHRHHKQRYARGGHGRGW